jgi:hypothetical protein
MRREYRLGTNKCEAFKRVRIKVRYNLADLLNPEDMRINPDFFDTTLPHGVREELFASERLAGNQPKRKRKPEAPIRCRIRIDWQTLGLSAASIAFIAFITVLSFSTHFKPRYSQRPMIITPPLTAATPASSPVAPGWNADGSGSGSAGLIPRVRRAERIYTIGKWTPVWMPDGALTSIRIWGVKDRFAELPSNPELGDAWGVLEGGQHALWVWHQLPGHVTPGWVDP